MSAAWLVIGLVVGAGVTALILRERIRALQTGQAQLSASFKAMSADALDASLKQLTELNRAQLEASEARATGELEQRRQAVEQLVKPMQQQLERLNKERVSASVQLTTQIKTLAEAQEKLRTETGALVTALREPGARGRWGQMQLRRVVELAGMVDHCDFSEQSGVQTGERALRPDMIVHLPGNRAVVVDAKAPRHELDLAYQAAEDASRRRHLQAHASLLRRHVKQLADKAYWSGVEEAPDFVVLFLPGEHLYGAMFEADPALIEDAMGRRVLIATPTTLLALLHSVAYGWQQERVAESAQAVAELGGELYRRLAKLSGLLGAVGNRLNSTVVAYNRVVGSYEARVVPGARRFVEHGVGTGGLELSSVEQLALSAREVQDPQDP